MWYLVNSGKSLMIPAWWGPRVAFHLTLKTTVLSVGPPGRLGVTPGDLSHFFDWSARDTCGLSGGLCYGWNFRAR